MKRVLIAAPFVAILFKLIQYFRWYVETVLLKVDYYTDYIFFIANLGVKSEFANRLLVGVPHIVIELVFPSLLLGALWSVLDKRKNIVLVLGLSVAILQYPISFGMIVPTIMGINMYIWGALIIPSVMLMCAVVATHLVSSLKCDKGC
ncbi:hypothetical protein [Teredinibacter waterburyi]|uniref:hypothetical protein n=1 Tax=Teredinibacter waterburyi TaxID=1500538 RepID=UPI00165F4429|nr:hypothetical protein [Teredinibacter waterburyi]